MSFVEYVKQIWKAGRSGGTPWSPDRLNHMEEGIKSCSDGISELNSNLSNVKLIDPTNNNINIDMINAPMGYILRIQTDFITGTSPSSVLSGNSYLLIGFSSMANNKLFYGVQMAIGFNSNKIAIRNASYNANGSSWSTWRTI